MLAVRAVLFLTASRGGYQGAVWTVTLAVPVMECAKVAVAVMVWVPGVINVMPFVKVWKPASDAVNV